MKSNLKHLKVRKLRGAGDLTEEQLNYVSYLLRLWQVQSAGRLIWRASLQSTATGERLGFADFESLVAFLLEEIAKTDELNIEQDRRDSGEG